MTGRSIVGVLITILAGAMFVSAGEDTPHEQALKQMLRTLDKLTMTLSGIRDADTAEAARDELRKGAKAWMESKNKMADLPPPEKAEKDRLAKLFKPRMDDALKKFFTEVGRVRGFPAGREVLQEIRAVTP